MVIKHSIEGYEAFAKFFKDFDTSNKVVHVLFSGSKSPTGESWCPDCVRATPIIEKALEKVDDNAHFVYVQVGDRDTFKDLNCKFRKDPKARILVVPTIIRWDTPQRLEGEQCEKQELVELLFSDED